MNTTVSHPSSFSGFTLVETLVAVSILLLVLVGPLAITARTAKSASFASEQVVAQFLAQEGVELVQKLRDDAVLGSSFLGGGNTTAWADFVRQDGPYAHCYSSTGCGLSITAGGEVALVNSVCGNASRPCALYFDDAANARARYTHTSAGNDDSPLFERRIYLDVSADPNSVLVRSEVTWSSGGVLATQRQRVESAVTNIYGID